MNKKIISILFAIILCLCMIIPAFAVESSSTTSNSGFANEYSRVLDYADVLSQEENDKLEAQFGEIANRQKVDIVICFANSLDGKKTADYTETLYEKHNYGYGENKDGIMLLVSFEEHDWYIATRGYAIHAFTDAGIQYIGNQIKGDLGDGNCFAAAEYFGQFCDELISDAKNGNVYGEPTGAIDNEDTGFVLPPPMWILISIGAGLIVALVVVGRMKRKLKTVNLQAAANSYLKSGSLNITESNDIFLYSNVTRTAKPKNNDNNNGSGSSTHESSSGNTYGGGGGKF